MSETPKIPRNLRKRNLTMCTVHKETCIEHDLQLNNTVQ